MEKKKEIDAYRELQLGKKKRGILQQTTHFKEARETRPVLSSPPMTNRLTKNTSSSHDALKVLSSNHRAASTSSFFNHIS